MAASTSDKITDVRNAARPNSARVTSGRSAGGTTLSCDNLAGWPTASKVHFVTYTIDSNSNLVAGTQLDCYGIVSGNNIGSFTVVDGSDTGNSVGDVVEMLPTAAWGQDLADALTAQHSRVGAHVGVANTGGMSTDTLSVSGAATVGGTLGVTGVATFTAVPLLPAGTVTPEDLVAGTGTTWPWASYTTTPTAGSSGVGGAITSRYVQIGKTVHFSCLIVLGSSGWDAALTLNLPVNINTNKLWPVGKVVFNDGSSTTYGGFALAASASTYTLRIFASGTNARLDSSSNSNPFSFSAGDEILIIGEYEAV